MILSLGIFCLLVSASFWRQTFRLGVPPLTKLQRADLYLAVCGCQFYGWIFLLLSCPATWSVVYWLLAWALFDLVAMKIATWPFEILEEFTQ